MKSLKLLLMLFTLAGLSSALNAQLGDQGLNSIMEIIDKAIAEANQLTDKAVTPADASQVENAANTVVNLSRTLGTLSYSRLQCGEAAVLAEFTRRVQQMPEANRDRMRDAFQEGFDKSKAETPLLSQDECERLTRSRRRSDSGEDTSIAQDEQAEAAAPAPDEESAVADNRQRHLRIAEITGQLAYRRKFCNDEKVFNRDYNEYLESIPQAYREDAKTAYWRGYKHGRRLNKNLTLDQC